MITSLLLLSLLAQDKDGFTPLFDGKTFDGWEGGGESFRIQDGAIVGGSLTKPTPRNEFLATAAEYADFELRLQVKLPKDSDNAGIQIRSRRIPNNHEMIGYQADVGKGWWGALYDESRRNKVLKGPDQAARDKAVKAGEWNDYRVRCEGKRIQIWINDALMTDYTEDDEKIELKGLIGLQIHGGPAGEVWYKDLRIKKLTP